MKSFASVALLAAAATSVSAKTDLEGCTSFTSWVTVRTEIGYGNTYQSIVWYDPENLEICQGVDCGGGRAPPKTVPGCPAYSGTETVTASFLTEDPLKPAKAVSTSTSASTTEDAVETTASADKEEDDEKEEEKTEKKEDDKKDDKKEEEVVATGTTMTTSAVKTPSPSSSGAQQPKETGAADSDKKEEDEEEKKEGQDGEATQSTNTPGAAAPTAAVALNVAAGLAAAFALL